MASMNRRQYFEINFLAGKMLNYMYFDLNFSEICFQGSNEQYVTIGSDDGLEPNR